MLFFKLMRFLYNFKIIAEICNTKTDCKLKYNQKNLNYFFAGKNLVMNRFENKIKLSEK